jgi:hypothetical protein
MTPDRERRRRWRLALGPDGDRPLGTRLSGADTERDGALQKLYGPSGSGPDGAPGAVRDIQSRQGRRTAGLGASAPGVARWLGDIRSYFPTTVVQVLQRDAMERLGLRRLLLEPELLQAVEPDVSLVATLVALNRVIPARSRETARDVVRTVTDRLEARLARRTRSAVAGALHRAARTRRPRPGDVDWNRTVRANLRHYQPELGTVIPERLIGYGRRQRSVERELILAIDQSASMASSVVYASVFGAVLAGMNAMRTSLVVFDTEVADLSSVLSDPVDILFATQLGGGTDINRAVAYCQSLVTRPQDTILVLISDLFEGGLRDELVGRMTSLVDDGAVVVALLALSDDGSPGYDHGLAADLAAAGVVSFACTPDAFPDLMAAAVERRDLGHWAAERGIVTTAPARV